MFNISVIGYEVVTHVLTLGYAAMAAAIFYFAMTIRQSHPKYRISAVLSVVVMVSAFLLLFAQKNSWTEAYAFNGSAYVLTDNADLFTNGYRYLNWLIDVPMLLIQILFVATLTTVNRTRYMTQFFISGPLMILTGYIGQFYEPGRLSENMVAWIGWGLVSSAFFVHVLFLITRVIREGKAEMDSKSKRVFGAILPLFYVSWFLYPIAYALPALMGAGLGYEFTIVGQQVTYTVADISSKIVYGVLLSVTAVSLSRNAGFQPGEVQQAA